MPGIGANKKTKAVAAALSKHLVSQGLLHPMRVELPREVPHIPQDVEEND